MEALPTGMVDSVYHGPTTFIPLKHDPYVEPKELGIFREIGTHPFQHVNAAEIVQRILRSREAFEERQRAKMLKSVGEAEFKNREDLGEMNNTTGID